MTDTVTIQDVPTLLERSLAVIRERGLTKNELEDPDGRVCARGAIMVALGASDLWGGNTAAWEMWRNAKHVVEPAEQLLADVAERRHPGRIHYSWDRLVEFNNDRETTQEEVEAVFEAAIAEARGESVNGG